jgi:hypothetical protein
VNESEDAIYDALSKLAGIDTRDTNLRDHPEAWAAMEALCLHAYAEGRKDEAAKQAKENSNG